MPPGTPAAMETILDQLAKSPVLVFLLTAMAVAIVVAAFTKPFTRREKPYLLVFNSENGRVEISREAIRKVVQQTCEEFREVSQSRNYLRQSRGHIHIKVRLLLAEETRVEEITKHLQKRITLAIRNDLGIKNLADVTVMVEGFTPEPMPDTD